MTEHRTCPKNQTGHGSFARRCRWPAGRVAPAILSVVMALSSSALALDGRPPPAKGSGAAPSPGAGSRPPSSGGAGSGSSPAPAPAAAGSSAAVTSSGSFDVVWLGPLPTRPAEQMRALAAEALPEADLTGVDDGSQLRIAQSASVERTWRYGDGRIVSAGQVQRSRDWVGSVVQVGTIAGKTWLAVRLLRKPDRAIDLETPAPTGAVDWFGDLPAADFAGASLWMLQKAGLAKGDMCDHREHLAAEIAAHVDAQCNEKWLGKPGSLTDPNLVFPSSDKILGFLAIEGGLAFVGGTSALRGQLGGQVVWTSRQPWFMSTTRIEIAAAYPTGMRYALDWLLGLQTGNRTTGLALQGGIGASGVASEEQDMLSFAIEFPARLQFHSELGGRQLLVWFEPSWLVLGNRANGSPSVAWCDQLRTGAWLGTKADGLGISGFGAELWETQGTRVITVLVGLTTFLR